MKSQSSEFQTKKKGINLKIFFSDKTVKIFTNIYVV